MSPTIITYLKNKFHHFDILWTNRRWQWTSHFLLRLAERTVSLSHGLTEVYNESHSFPFYSNELQWNSYRWFWTFHFLLCFSSCPAERYVTLTDGQISAKLAPKLDHHATPSKSMCTHYLWINSVLSSMGEIKIIVVWENELKLSLWG